MDCAPRRLVSRLPWVLMVLSLLMGPVGCSSPQEEEWISLFNGEDLAGWTMKISGYELGEDPWGTVRVEDGFLTVGYENYDEFHDRFGHLFFEEPFSHPRSAAEGRCSVPGRR